MHTYVFLGTKEHCLREEQQMIDNESSQFDRNTSVCGVNQRNCEYIAGCNCFVV